MNVQNMAVRCVCDKSRMVRFVFDQKVVVDRISSNISSDGMNA
jgi:hypothetical protein